MLLSCWRRQRKLDAKIKCKADGQLLKSLLIAVSDGGDCLQGSHFFRYTVRAKCSTCYNSKGRSVSYSRFKEVIMEDVLTEIPPPSRFFQEDLNNFVPPSPSLPSPFLLFSNPKPNLPLRPSLLTIALSPPSLCIFHGATERNLIGSLVIPEIPYSGLSAEPSLSDKTCNVYALGDDHENHILLVTVQCSVTIERCHVIAKRLIGEAIIPERVVIFSSIPSALFRGKLSPDESYVFKLETTRERERSAGNDSGDISLLKGLDYFPSGSVVDSLAAALLSRCEITGLKGALCVSWPEFDGSAASLLKSVLEKNLLPKYKFRLGSGDISMELYRFSRMKNHPFESELYS